MTCPDPPGDSRNISYPLAVTGNAEHGASLFTEHAGKVLGREIQGCEIALKIRSVKIDASAVQTHKRAPRARGFGSQQERSPGAAPPPVLLLAESIEAGNRLGTVDKNEVAAVRRPSWAVLFWQALPIRQNAMKVAAVRRDLPDRAGIALRIDENEANAASIRGPDRRIGLCGKACEFPDA